MSTKDEPRSAVLVREMVALFGWYRASILLGMFTIAQATGVEATRDGFLRAKHIGSHASRYRAMQDLAEYVVHLAEVGLLPGGQSSSEVIAELRKVGPLLAM